MVGPGGLEPPTPALSTRCSNQLSYEPKFLNEFDWWSRSGSNRRPPECKSGALPTELRPRQVVGSNRPFNELMEVKNIVLQKLFCVILDGSTISLLETSCDRPDYPDG